MEMKEYRKGWWVRMDENDGCLESLENLFGICIVVICAHSKGINRNKKHDWFLLFLMKD